MEAGYLTISGIDFACYVNSHYLDLDEAWLNERASSLFVMGSVGMAGGGIRGDTLLVLAPGRGEYDRSLPSELIAWFIDADREDAAGASLT